jgi:hypothetical protein
MLIGIFDLTFPADLDPKLLLPQRKKLQPSGAD